MSKKQTAVEWLYDQIWKISISNWHELLNQAKQMEKEQIMDAWYNGSNDGSTICSQHYNKPAQQYYNETYGEEN